MSTTYVFLCQVEQMILALVHIVLCASNSHHVGVAGLARGELDVHLVVCHDLADCAATTADEPGVHAVVNSDLLRHLVFLRTRESEFWGYKIRQDDVFRMNDTCSENKSVSTYIQKIFSQ